MSRTLIAGHRGAPRLAHENTIASYEAVIATGADMIEFDVRRTKDNILVVHHDAHIGDHALNEITFEQAQALATAAGFDLPTFEQAVQTMRNRIKLDVELKEAGYESEVVEIVLRHVSPDDVIFTSFDDNAVIAVKHQYPHLTTGLLLWMPPESLPLAYPKQRIDDALADAVAPHWEMADDAFLTEAAAHGKPAYVWTVNGEDDIKRFLADTRVVGIISDYPDVVVKLRNDYEAAQ